MVTSCTVPSLYLGSFMSIDLVVALVPGPASVPGGEGSTADGGGEREGGVETQGQGPHHGPAGEGGPDPLPQSGAGEMSERYTGNTPALTLLQFQFLTKISLNTIFSLPSCSNPHERRGEGPGGGRNVGQLMSHLQLLTSAKTMSLTSSAANTHGLQRINARDLGDPLTVLVAPKVSHKVILSITLRFMTKGALWNVSIVPEAIG